LIDKLANPPEPGAIERLSRAIKQVGKEPEDIWLMIDRGVCCLWSVEREGAREPDRAYLSFWAYHNITAFSYWDMSDSWPTTHDYHTLSTDEGVALLEKALGGGYAR